MTLEEEIAALGDGTYKVHYCIVSCGKVKKGVVYTIEKVD